MAIYYALFVFDPDGIRVEVNHWSPHQSRARSSGEVPSETIVARTPLRGGARVHAHQWKGRSGETRHRNGRQTRAQEREHDGQWDEEQEQQTKPAWRG